MEFFRFAAADMTVVKVVKNCRLSSRPLSCSEPSGHDGGAKVEGLMMAKWLPK